MHIKIPSIVLIVVCCIFDPVSGHESIDAAVGKIFLNNYFAPIGGTRPKSLGNRFLYSAEYFQYIKTNGWEKYDHNERCYFVFAVLVSKISDGGGIGYLLEMIEKKSEINSILGTFIDIPINDLDKLYFQDRKKAEHFRSLCITMTNFHEFRGLDLK